MAATRWNQPLSIIIYLSTSMTLHHYLTPGTVVDMQYCVHHLEQGQAEVTSLGSESATNPTPTLSQP